MEWLYPELKRINLKDRSSALQEAKASSFDAIDLVGIGIALFLAVVVTRYSATGLGALGRIRAALWNFMVAMAFANTLKNVRGRKQIKLDRDMLCGTRYGGYWPVSTVAIRPILLKNSVLKWLFSFDSF